MSRGSADGSAEVSETSGVEPTGHRFTDPIEEASWQWERRGLLEPLAMLATVSVVRAAQILNTTVDRALKPYGLSFARYELLMVLRLSTRGCLPMTRIGERLMVHPTGITKVIDRLEAQGLVRRETPPTDRRVTLACITPAGRRLVDKVAPVVAGVRNDLNMDDGNLADLIKAVTEFRRRAGDVVAD